MKKAAAMKLADEMDREARETAIKQAAEQAESKEIIEEMKSV